MWACYPLQNLINKKKKRRPGSQIEWSTPEMEIGNGVISDGAGSPVCLPAPPPPLASTLPPPTNSVWSSPGHWPLRTPGLGLRKCPLGCLGPWMPDQLLHRTTSVSTLAPRRHGLEMKDTLSAQSHLQHLQGAGGARGAVSTCLMGMANTQPPRASPTTSEAHLCLLPPSPGPHLGLKTGHKEPLVTTPFPPYSCFSSRREKHIVSPW